MGFVGIAFLNFFGGALNALGSVSTRIVILWLVSDDF